MRRDLWLPRRFVRSPGLRDRTGLSAYRANCRFQGGNDSPSSVEQVQDHMLLRDAQHLGRGIRLRLGNVALHRPNRNATPAAVMAAMIVATGPAKSLSTSFIDAARPAATW